jgi:hypothetical protein
MAGFGGWLMAESEGVLMAADINQRMGIQEGKIGV